MIITGCQRSGTMTTAQVFGIPHERIFAISGIHNSEGETHWNKPEFDKICELFADCSAVNESSWMAQPFVQIFEKHNIPIIHLVRHPLSVIASLVGIRFFSPTPQLEAEGVTLGSAEGNGHKPYLDFVLHHLPGLKNLKTPLEKSMYYWLYWNKPLSKYPRIQIEQIANAPQLNSRLKAHMLWSEIPSGQLKSEVEELAEIYNYAF